MLSNALTWSLPLWSVTFSKTNCSFNQNLNFFFHKFWNFISQKYYVSCKSRCMFHSAASYVLFWRLIIWLIDAICMHVQTLGLFNGTSTRQTVGYPWVPAKRTRITHFLIHIHLDSTWLQIDISKGRICNTTHEIEICVNFKG